jgi:uncharacterized protein
MRLVLDTDPGINLVRRYDQQGVVVGSERLTRSFLLGRELLVRDWPPQSLAAMRVQDLHGALPRLPKVLLLGVVQASPLAPAALRRELAAGGIALEALELGAACRTYNVLAQENREVILGVILTGAGSAPEEDTGRKD